MNMKVMLATLMLAVLLAGCGNGDTAGQSSISVSESISESSSLSESQSASDEAMQKTMSLSELTEEQLSAFKIVSEREIDTVISGERTVEELDIYQVEVLTNDYRTEYKLPANYVDLFKEWKDSTGYYEQFKQSVEPNAKPGV